MIHFRDIRKIEGSVEMLQSRGARFVYHTWQEYPNVRTSQLCFDATVHLSITERRQVDSFGPLPTSNVPYIDFISRDMQTCTPRRQYDVFYNQRMYHPLNNGDYIDQRIYIRNGPAIPNRNTQPWFDVNEILAPFLLYTERDATGLALQRCYAGFGNVETREQQNRNRGTNEAPSTSGAPGSSGGAAMGGASRQDVEVELLGVVNPSQGISVATVHPCMVPRSPSFSPTPDPPFPNLLRECTPEMERGRERAAMREVARNRERLAATTPTEEEAMVAEATRAHAAARQAARDRAAAAARLSRESQRDRERHETRERLRTGRGERYEDDESAQRRYTRGKK